MHKITLLLLVFGLATIQYVYGVPLDNPGLKEHHYVTANNKNFQIETVANFEINDLTFDDSTQKLRFEISSGAKNNIAEILIPKEMAPDGFSFYLNDEEFKPVVKSNDQIFFVTMQFNGTGNHVIEAKLNAPIVNEQSTPKETLPAENNFLYIGIGSVIAAAVGGIAAYKIKKKK